MITLIESTKKTISAFHFAVKILMNANCMTNNVFTAFTYLLVI